MPNQQFAISFKLMEGYLKTISECCHSQEMKDIATHLKTISEKSWTINVVPSEIVLQQFDPVAFKEALTQALSTLQITAPAVTVTPTVTSPVVTVTPTITPPAVSVSSATDLSGLIEAISCLVAAQRSLVAITGGVNPTGCDDIGSGGGGLPDGGGGGSQTDCSTIESAVAGIIDVLDWLVWGLETIGGALAGPIISALVKFRWFVAILVAAGLVEPSPAEEVVTIPLGLVAVLTYFMEDAIEIGAAALREMVNQMKVSQKQIAAVICGEGEIDLKLDEVVDAVVDALTDEATKEGIKIMLKKFLKAPDIKKVLL
jgi:hypothetical protein